MKRLLSQANKREVLAGSIKIDPVKRVSAQVLMFVLLLAVFGQLITAMAFRDRMEQVRSTDSDNNGWVVAQLEVDYQDLVIAQRDFVLAETGTSDIPLDQALKSLRLEFDIYYSRLDVLSGKMRNKGISPIIEANLLPVRAARDQMAEMIDAASLDDLSSLEGLGPLLDSQEEIVRTLTVDYLQFFIDGMTDARLAEEALFYRFFFQALALSVLIAVGTVLVVRLWRDLELRTNQTGRIAATLTKAFNSTLSAVVVTDMNGRIRFCNEQTSEIFGYDTEFLQGVSAREALVAPSMYEAYDRQLSLITETGKWTASGEGTVPGFGRRSNGEVFPIEMSVVVDEDVDGTPILLSFIRDVSAQRAAEAQMTMALNEAENLARVAEESASAKSAFVATISHEMRTPLHGLMASLELINSDTLTDDNQHFLSIAQECGTRALAQVNDILDFTRIGESVEQPTVFDPVAIAKSIFLEVLPIANKRNNELKLNVDGFDGPCALVGLPLAFSRALYNLVGNASKFTENGTITVRLDMQLVDDGTAQLDVSVSDTGIGISPEDHKRIFQKFETATEADRGPSSGTGLGLAITTLAVEKMGGTLGLDSTLGFGSRFHFSIPLKRVEKSVEATADVVDMSKLATVEVPKLDILVVDDNRVNRTLLCEMLHRMDHTTETASDGSIAVEMAEAKHYDLILMDFSMPVMDGQEATRRIRSGKGPNKGTIIFGVTAYAHFGNDPDAPENQPFNDILIKPMGQQDLAAAITRAFCPSDTLPMPAPSSANLAEAPAVAQDARIDLPHPSPQSVGQQPASHFSAIIAAIGKEQAIDLIGTALGDAREAQVALGELGGPLPDRADRIHKAVGSTGMIGMTLLSEYLATAEELARDGDDPADSELPEMVKDAIAIEDDLFQQLRVTLGAAE